MHNYIKAPKFSIKDLLDDLRTDLKNEEYIIYKEEKDNKIFSSNFEELKKELLKYNIEFDRVPNKRVYFYIKHIKRP